MQRQFLLSSLALSARGGRAAANKTLNQEREKSFLSSCRVQCPRWNTMIVAACNSLSLSLTFSPLFPLSFFSCLTLSPPCVLGNAVIQAYARTHIHATCVFICLSERCSVRLASERETLIFYGGNALSLHFPCLVCVVRYVRPSSIVSVLLRT